MNNSYTHRNLAVCNAFGIIAGLDLCYRRMAARKDCPQWLKDQLADLLIRAYKSKTALVEFRELAPQQHATKDNKPVCTTCHGTGQICAGSSLSESDGYAPVVEPCPECGG